MSATISVLVGFVSILAIAAPVLAAPPADSRAAVEPALAHPGETLHLTYTTGAPGPLDVGVQRTATCTVRAPDGSQLPCAPDTTLVVAHVSPGSTSYAWEIPAPSGLGNYTVAFEESDLLALPGAAGPATAHFEVAHALPAGEPLQSDATKATGAGGGVRVFVDPFTNPLASIGTSEPSAMAKFTLASAASAGSLVLLLITQRFGA